MFVLVKSITPYFKLPFYLYTTVINDNGTGQTNRIKLRIIISSQPRKDTVTATVTVVSVAQQSDTLYHSHAHTDSDSTATSTSSEFKVVLLSFVLRFSIDHTINEDDNDRK